VGLDENGMPIMCSEPCLPLQTKFKDTIAGLQGDAKTKMLKDLEELDNMITGPDKVRRTQELAAELNNIKNNKVVPSTGSTGKNKPNDKSRFYTDEHGETFDMNTPLKGQNKSDFISEHAFNKHKYNPSKISTKSSTQYGKDIDALDIQNQTLNNPDEIVPHYNDEGVHYADTYKKEFSFNISTLDTPTPHSRAVIFYLDATRSSQFPFYKP
jgi:hypothetical protein